MDKPPRAAFLFVLQMAFLSSLPPSRVGRLAERRAEQGRLPRRGEFAPQLRLFTSANVFKDLQGLLRCSALAPPLLRIFNDFNDLRGLLRLLQSSSAACSANSDKLSRPRTSLIEHRNRGFAFLFRDRNGRNVHHAQAFSLRFL